MLTAKHVVTASECFFNTSKWHEANGNLDESLKTNPKKAFVVQVILNLNPLAPGEGGWVNF